MSGLHSAGMQQDSLSHDMTALSGTLQTHVKHRTCQRPTARRCTHALQLALIGAPNVGKSSLVAVLSSGTPEVCNYPFTTRSVKMGHFYVNHIRHQARPLQCGFCCAARCTIML